MASRKVLISLMAIPLLVMGGAALSGESAGGLDNVVTALEVQNGPVSTQVVLHAKSTPTFTVFKLKNPDRLVVDLIHTDLAEATKKPLKVDDARVGRIATSQFKQAGSVVSRVIFGLRKPVRFQAKAQGQSVVVTITDEDAPKAPAKAWPPSFNAKAMSAGSSTRALCFLPLLASKAVKTRRQRPSFR